MRLFHFILTLAVAALDLGSKWWIQAHFELHEAKTIVPGMFSITHVRNSGVAFGMLRELDSPYKPLLLSLIALAALLAIFLYSRFIGEGHRWVHLALSIVMGGILGNFLDRFYHGSVLDFLDVYWKQWHWPTFNVADSAITLGIIALLLDSFRPGGRTN